MSTKQSEESSSTIPRVVAVVSGGLDSTTMVYDLVARGFEVDCLSFNYGQRHKKELTYAAATAKQLGLRHDIIDLTGLTHLISNSALTSQNKTSHPAVPRTDRAIEVPDGHYAEENMKLTVVPNRNMIMLSIAAGIAVNRNVAFIATAIHAGDHFIYPDCRPRFIAHANAAIVAGNEGFGPIPEQAEGVEPMHYIEAPFLYMTKADIAAVAIQLNVPLHLTWSCYKGGVNHCGRCGTCVERLEAIDEAIRRGVSNNEWITDDLTVYDDTEYWRTVTSAVR